MPDYPPYMNSYGNITRILDKIKDAQTPSRFTHDYLETVLGFSGGSARPFVSFAKRIGLLESDGAPTDLYRRFRNPADSEQAMAQAIRIGYPELFKRNEFAHHLDSEGLQGLVTEITGLESDSGTLRAIVKSFEALKEYANFELTEVDSQELAVDEEDGVTERGPQPAEGRGVTLSHTITINLPESTNPEVFNAIFKALKENLLL